MARCDPQPLMRDKPAVLVIAGTDSSGGAGLVRDVIVLTHHGVDAMCVVTAVTAQSNTRTDAVYQLPHDLIRQQIAAAFATRPMAAIKIGMLGNRSTVAAVADSLPASSPPLVLDPVLIASSGGTLLDDAGRQSMQKDLFPRASLITPNIPEAAALLDVHPARNVDQMIDQARLLLAMGPHAVLLKGGHMDGDQAIDVLVWPAGELRLTAPRVSGTRRGTGCTLAAAIAASLASGKDLADACLAAKKYLGNCWADRSDTLAAG
jgi:hydroxymethylpyrimidine/phosphomethylpyrimidine kinase